MGTLRGASVRLEGGLFSRAGDEDLVRHLRTGVEIVMQRILADAVRLAPGNLGHLRQSLAASVDVERTARGRARRLIGRVGTPLEYGRWMELGTRHGVRWPPRAPIEAWVRRKFQLAPGEQDEIDRLTFAVRRAIGRRGLKPRRYLRDAVRKNEAWARQALGEQVYRWALQQSR